MKKELRVKIKEKISRLSQDYCRRADQKIFENVIGLNEYKAADTVFCYVGTANEIDTMPILMHALESGRRLGVPKCVSKGIMEVYEIKSIEDLAVGAYGIMEPVQGCRRLSPKEIQFVCVPCLTCSSDGKRLGFGGGFYDRYLQHVKCPKAVLCRGEVMDENIPMDIHDLVMDIVVTENTIYRN